MKYEFSEDKKGTIFVTFGGVPYCEVVENIEGSTKSIAAIKRDIEENFKEEILEICKKPRKIKERKEFTLDLDSLSDCVSKEQIKEKFCKMIDESIPDEYFSFNLLFYSDYCDEIDGLKMQISVHIEKEEIDLKKTRYAVNSIYKREYSNKLLRYKKEKEDKETLTKLLEKYPEFKKEDSKCKKEDSK